MPSSRWCPAYADLFLPQLGNLHVDKVEDAGNAVLINGATTTVNTPSATGITARGPSRSGSPPTAVGGELLPRSRTSGPQP